MVLGQLDMSVKDNGLEFFLHTTHLRSTHGGASESPAGLPQIQTSAAHPAVSDSAGSVRHFENLHF